MIGFIFYQSSMTADDSAAESSSLLAAVNKLFGALGLGAEMTDHLIRKAAHFSEFFVLGALLFFTMRSYCDRDVPALIYPAGAGLLVALSDEFIQTFSEGRSCELRDVLLDLSGALTAVVVFYLVVVLIRKSKKKRENRSE